MASALPLPAECCPSPPCPSSACGSPVDFTSLVTQILGQHLPFINVKNAPYHAKGDGVTDDTAAIQAAFNDLSTLGGWLVFPTGVYLISSPITFTPTHFGGYIIDGRACTILATGSPDYAFHFRSLAWPQNLRNVFIRDFMFDGTVTKTFLYVENTATWNCTLQSIRSTLAATANALIQFHNNSAVSQGGMNTLRNITSNGHILYTLYFTADAGTLPHFDDLLIEDIRSVDPSPNPASALIALGDGAYLTDCNLRQLFKSGGTFVLVGLGNSYILHSLIENIYAEPHLAVFRAINVGLINCTVCNVKLFLDPLITTDSRCLLSQAVNCRFSNLLILNTGGTAVGTVMYEEAASPPSSDNWLDRVGIDPTTAIILKSTHSRIEGNYGDPFILARGGYVRNYSAGAIGNDVLFEFTGADLLASRTFRLKIKGETSASANNLFNIDLTGTGVALTFLNYVLATANTFDIEADITWTHSAPFNYLMVIYRVIVGTTIVSHAVYGSPLILNIVVPLTAMQVKINVTNSDLIGIWNTSVERIDRLTKPTLGFDYP